MVFNSITVNYSTRLRLELKLLYLWSSSTTAMDPEQLCTVLSNPILKINCPSFTNPTSSVVVRSSFGVNFSHFDISSESARRILTKPGMYRTKASNVVPMKGLGPLKPPQGEKRVKLCQTLKIFNSKTTMPKT